MGVPDRGDKLVMKTIERLDLLPSSPGTARHILLHRYGKRGASPKVYVQAALHANELPAILVAQHLIDRLDEADAGGRIRGEIIIVPAANPIGLGQTVDGVHLGRYDLATGQNFNRGFIDHADALVERIKSGLGSDADANARLIRRCWAELIAERTAASELDSLRKHLLSLALDADIVLDLHSADEAVLHIYLGTARCPDGADLSADLGSHATLLATDSGGEPFDEVFGNIWAKLRQSLASTHPIPDAILSATVECRGHSDVSDELAFADAAALLRFFVRRGAVSGEPGPLPQPLCDGTPLSAVDTLVAPIGGCLVYKATVGAHVRKGDIVAEIINPLAITAAERRVAVHSATDGVLYSRKMLRQVRPGQSCGKVAGRDPLPTRKGALLEP
jgi:predicted deacylase